MKEEEVAKRLNRILHHMQVMIVLQLLADFFMIYTFVKLIVVTTPDISLMDHYFSRQSGTIILIFLAIIDLSFTAIRRNDRLSGQSLIAELGGQLDDTTLQLVRRFKQYK